MASTVQFPTRSDRKGLNTSTPLKAIRAMCLECVCYQAQEVTDCTGTDCPLFPFRMGKVPRGAGSRLKAIRKHCLDCMNGSAPMVRECTSDPQLSIGELGCPVYEYRFGKNPRRAGIGGQGAARNFLFGGREPVFQAPGSTISP